MWIFQNTDNYQSCQRVVFAFAAALGTKAAANAKTCELFFKKSK